jgi:DNA-binding transcriptional regulator YiaG
MLDYGIPEPQNQPIIAPSSSRAICRAKGLPLPARPDWLCLTSPEYRNSKATYNYGAHELTDEEAEAKERTKREKEEAREALRNAHIEAAQKREAERRSVSDRASAARKAKRLEDDKRKAKKTPEELKVALQRNAALAHAAHTANVAKRASKIPANHIQEVRLSRKLSKHQLAQLLRVSNQSMSGYESGKLIMSERIQKRFEQFEKDTKEVADEKKLKG